MTTESELIALAERVEAATGPDRELDECIGMAIGLKNTMRVGHECLGTDRVVPVRCPTFTASLDAAMTLVPEGCDWSVDNFDGANGKPSAWVHVRKSSAAIEQVTGATPALALTAAALRARAAAQVSA